MLYSPPWLGFNDIRCFNSHAMLFDLTSARTAGQCMDHSRWTYPKFIG